MARSYWRPTRWQRFTWWLEDWAPGESLSGYVEFLWHRLGCKLGWVPHQGDINAGLGPANAFRKRRPELQGASGDKLVLCVPIASFWNDPASAKTICNPPPPVPLYQGPVRDPYWTITDRGKRGQA